MADLKYLKAAAMRVRWDQGELAGTSQGVDRTTFRPLPGLGSVPTHGIFPHDKVGVDMCGEAEEHHIGWLKKQHQVAMEKNSGHHPFCFYQ